MLSKSKIFYSACIAFLLGVAVESAKIPMYCIFIGWIGLVWIWIRSRVHFAFGILMVAAIYMGVMRMRVSFPKVDARRIEYYQGQTMTFQGLVSSEPDRRRGKTNIDVSVKSLLKENSWTKADGKILVQIPMYPEYAYGDLLEVSCKIQIPKNKENFDYQKYLARYDTYSVCYSPKMSYRGNKSPHAIKKYALTVKDFFMRNINSLITEPHASLLNGILLGAKRGLPEKLKEDFQTVGISHIIAVSGYNITILATIFMKFFQRIGFRKKFAAYISIAGIVFFVCMTGVQSSIIRAAIMGVSVLLIQQSGRLNDIKRILVLSALIMTIQNPKVLLFDVGFALSFVATLGLVYFSPIVEARCDRMKLSENIKECFAPSLAAIIMTAPYITFIFQRISLVAPIINVIVLPLIPGIMLLGAIVGIAPYFIPAPIIFPILAPLWYALDYIIRAASLGAKLPCASVSTPKISVCVLVGSYVCYAAYLRHKGKENSLKHSRR